MFDLAFLIDTSVLPPNIMILRDEDFIDFVKTEVGEAVALLLEIQGINCVKSLLMTPDIYAVMNIKCKTLDNFKKKYAHLQDDGTCILQSGIKGNADYLIDLLKKKCVQDAKLSKVTRHNECMLQLDKTTMKKSSHLSASAHKKYIVDTLSNWWKMNKSRFNLSQLYLLEGQYYFISIQNNPDGLFMANIKCACGKCISLTLTLYGRMLPKGNIAAVFYLKPPYNRIESILLYHHKLKYLSLECFIFD